MVVPLLHAQTSSQDRRGWRKVQIRKKVEEMRRAMREGRIVRYNVRVKVRLKNGNRMKGIVRNGRFIEKHDGLDFVVTNKRSAHAGLRLWYYNGTNSYIFLPHASIAYYKLGNRMTDEQVRDLERRLMEAELQRRELERRLLEDRRKRGAEGKPPEDGKPADQAEAETRKYGRPLTDVERNLLKWLEEYSPDKGWGKTKLRDLQVRRITLGVYPNQEEKRFEKHFDEWAKALKLEELLTGGGAEKKPPTPSGSGSEGLKGASNNGAGKLPPAK